ncbi:hypothetical protein ACNKHN_00320 [Shigella flexneri]
MIKKAREQHEALRGQPEQGPRPPAGNPFNGGEKAQALAESIEEQDDDTNLIAFATNLFILSPSIRTIRGDKTRTSVPYAVRSDAGAGLPLPAPEDGITITFDREAALAREMHSLLPQMIRHSGMVRI